MTGLGQEAMIACDLLREAGEQTMWWYRRRGLAVRTKGDGSPVTEADREIERWLRHRLGEAFPGDGILGEEFGETASDTGRRWILDPIDGTKSFVRGVPLFANLLALEVHGVVTAGVINLPASGELVAAETGRGCWADGRRARVSGHREAAGAHVLATWLEDWPGTLLDRLRHRGATVRGWGDAFGYAMVATGRAEAIVDFRVEPYDVAPMSVVLTEAGGRFTGLDGRAGHHRGSGLGSNGLVHDGLLGLVGTAGSRAA